jgi:hypothetical protein
LVLQVKNKKVPLMNASMDLHVEPGTIGQVTLQVRMSTTEKRLLLQHFVVLYPYHACEQGHCYNYSRGHV